MRNEELLEEILNTVDVLENVKDLISLKYSEINKLEEIKIKFEKSLSFLNIISSSEFYNKNVNEILRIQKEIDELVILKNKVELEKEKIILELKANI